MKEAGYLEEVSEKGVQKEWGWGGRGRGSDTPLSVSFGPNRTQKHYNVSHDFPVPTKND